MQDYVAFLRGINLGRRRLTMDVLRAQFEQLKFKRVTTFIASGNVLFASSSAEEGALRQRIEQQLGKTLGYPVETFLRTRAEVAAMAALRPFAGTEFEVPGHVVYAVMLQEAIEPSLRRKLRECETAVDYFRVAERDLYWLCQIRSSDSTVWTSPPMKALKLPSTTVRNMNTIDKIAALFVSRLPGA